MTASENDWAEAMQEQSAATATGDKAADGAAEWEAALVQQTQASRPQSLAVPATSQAFPALADTVPRTAPMDMDLDRIKNIPVQLTTELGRTRITIKDLLRLQQGSIVELDGLAGQALDVLINGHLIAQGEVVVVNEKYGIRLTDIVVGPSERIQRLAAGK